MFHHVQYMATLSEANSQEHIYQLFQTGEEEANISKLIKVGEVTHLYFSAQRPRSSMLVVINERATDRMSERR